MNKAETLDLFDRVALTKVRADSSQRLTKSQRLTFSQLRLRRNFVSLAGFEQLPMKKAAGIFPFVFIFFFLSSVSAFAAGKPEEPETPPLNNEWILCITEFDSSSLPEDERTIAGVFARRLVDAIKTVNYRIRVSPEYTYYEDYAWSQTRTAAAKALAVKQDERALLLYQGEPGWRYRQNLKKKDDEIALLRETLKLTETKKPLINREPAFGLVSGNSDGTFPASPADGAEYRFCQTQKADAFLAGAIREYYGRFFVTLRLYVLYTDSFIYEDDVIFSADDLESAASEIAGRLTAALAGSKPAAITVRAEPADSLILINQSFAGRGNVPATEIPQGKTTIAFSREGYNPHTVETELAAGELAEVDVTLGPRLFGDVNITVPENTGVSVYQGALYVGEAPLTMRLPLNQLDYVTAVTAGGETAGAVYLTPFNQDETHTLSLKTKIALPSGEMRVNKARRAYYWAWGGTWITGIAAWVSYGIFSGQNSALPQSTSYEFYKDTERIYYFSIGAVIATGIAVAYEIFQMARYLYTATSKATPIVKTEVQR